MIRLLFGTIIVIVHVIIIIIIIAVVIVSFQICALWSTADAAATIGGQPHVFARDGGDRGLPLRRSRRQ